MNESQPATIRPPDKLNLIEFSSSSEPAEKVLYLSVIQDAVQTYLYAMLNSSSPNVEEFFSAHQYIFKMDSTNPETYKFNRTTKSYYKFQDKKITKNHYLTDNDVQTMCFDTHYFMSGLSQHMDITKFRESLKLKRQFILKSNWQSVVDRINYLYQKELSSIGSGKQVPLQVWQDDLLTILSDPPTPFHLANLVYVPAKSKRSSKKKAKKNKTSKYQSLAEELKKTIPAEANWGPLANISSCSSADRAEQTDACHD